MTGGEASPARAPGRLAAGVAGLLALVLLAGPLALGAHAQRAYQDALAATLEAIPAGWVIFEHYDRGWFSSSAQAELAFQGGPQAPIPLHLRLDSRVHHGPWHWLSASWPPVLTRVETRVEVAGDPSPLPPLAVVTDIALDGSAQARLHLPADDRAGRQGAYRLVNGPLEGSVSVAAEGRRISVDLHLAALELRAPRGSIAGLTDLALRADLHPLGRGLYGGSAGVTLGSGALGMAGNASGVDDLSLTLSQAGEDGRADLRMDLSAAGLALRGHPYRDINLGLRADGLDTVALADLAAGLKAMTSGAVSEAMRGMVGAALLAQVLPRLAAAGPRLALDALQIGTPEGPVEASLSLGLASPTDGRADTGADIDDPAVMILGRLTGEGAIALPRQTVLDWLAETPRPREQGPGERIGQWLAGGWVSEQGGRIASDFRLADGLLTVNGNRVPLLPGAGAVGL